MSSDKLLPHDFSRWDKDATPRGLRTTPLSGLPKIASASGFSVTEFLALRALWPRRKSFNQFPKEDPQLYDQADKILEKLTGFWRFVEHVVDRNTDYDAELRDFALVQLAWLELLRSDKPNDQRESSGSFLQIWGAPGSALPLRQKYLGKGDPPEATQDRHRPTKSVFGERVVSRDRAGRKVG